MACAITCPCWYWYSGLSLWVVVRSGKCFKQTYSVIFTYWRKKYHNGVMWVSWRLISQTIQPFVHQLVQVTNKGEVGASRECSSEDVAVFLFLYTSSTHKIINAALLSLNTRYWKAKTKEQTKRKTKTTCVVEMGNFGRRVKFGKFFHINSGCCWSICQLIVTWRSKPYIEQFAIKYGTGGCG